MSGRMNWAGFSGSESELTQYLASLKTWATGVALKRRRLDLSEEIEGKALEYLVERNLVGSPFNKILEQYVVKECQVTDSYSTKRDGDLSAAMEDFQGSFIDEFIVDSKSVHIEDHIISILDNQAVIDEGKDQCELEKEADEACYFLSLRDETLLSLKYQFGYTQAMMSAHLGAHHSSISKWYRKAIRRQKLLNECHEFLSKMRQEVSYTQLIVNWISYEVV